MVCVNRPLFGPVDENPLDKRRFDLGRGPHRERCVCDPTNQRWWFHASHESAHNAGISCRISPYEALSMSPWIRASIMLANLTSQWSKHAFSG